MNVNAGAPDMIIELIGLYTKEEAKQAASDIELVSELDLFRVECLDLIEDGVSLGKCQSFSSAPGLRSLGDKLATRMAC